MKSVLKYPGAKNRIAKQICRYIPKHDVYLEPFAGSLAVLLNKPRSHIETVNDIDMDIVNFFHILRERGEELKRMIRLTPYARNEYIRAFEYTEDEVERARRFCVRCWMGYGCGNLYQNGFRSGQQSHSPNPANAWAMLPDTIEESADRLKGVQIENLPAIELLARYNTEDVFAYLDPPYLHGTRKNYLYKYEMTDEDHETMLKTVLNHPGIFLISGYENDMYNDYLSGWRKAIISTQSECGYKRKEVLWMNYEDEQMSINDFEGVLP